MSSGTAAVLFDIDGTLVDSNYLHIHAWCRAFAEVGVGVESWRIHRSIGMDGSELVKSLAAEAGENAQERASELHSRYYKDTAPLLRVLPGARELLTRVAALGLQVVLATSAPEDELSILRELLDSEDIVSTVTSSEDVETAKPEPAIVEIALRGAGVSASRAVFVGDSVWDAKASVRAGVPVVGVLSGGISRAELESAGASVVLDNAADLLTTIDTTPIADLAKLVGTEHP